MQTQAMDEGTGEGQEERTCEQPGMINPCQAATMQGEHTLIAGNATMVQYNENGGEMRGGGEKQQTTATNVGGTATQGLLDEQEGDTDPQLPAPSVLTCWMEEQLCTCNSKLQQFTALDHHLLFFGGNNLGQQ